MFSKGQGVAQDSTEAVKWFRLAAQQGYTLAALAIETEQQIGDGTLEHETCYKYGFVTGTAPYSECRLKIDVAKSEYAQRQAAYELEKQRYQEEQRRYEARVAEVEREKERRKYEGLMKFGLALMGGTSPNFTDNLNSANRAMGWAPPTPPAPPAMLNFTITGPKGVTTCTITGNVYRCF